VQVSFQAPEQQLADRIAGVQSHRQKIRAAEIIKGTGIALSLNVVLHRLNIDCLEQIIAFAEKLGATRLELANTQYYGWAYRNRSILIPTRVQVEAAARIALEARKRLAGTMEILYVLPDYFTERPKPCMNGWGQRYLTVNPSGSVLPCPTAGDLPGLAFESVRRRSLAWIWSESESFNRFRGTEWMPDPCRSCPRKELDFGGCRCQAALLTGDPANTDPACEFSPYHRLVREAVENGGIHAVTEQLVYRQNP
jgi:pyrroloquinoline quinone biosynthesis protein E